MFAAPLFIEYVNLYVIKFSVKHKALSSVSADGEALQGIFIAFFWVLIIFLLIYLYI